MRLIFSDKRRDTPVFSAAKTRSLTKSLCGSFVSLWLIFSDV
ncbi:Uncharacterized protein dnm_062310 [Desulfonema magnum]|uniref:Uncharacterized protein n=1 Tax=Desulfonema magnum TaxID=45655 RepID=A0A975BRC7_9BACT|nr:Uncharacterized protein dnm_062310 [Desulfonema magnum]